MTADGKDRPPAGTGPTRAGVFAGLGRRRAGWIIAASAAAFVMLGGGAYAFGSALGGSGVPAPVPAVTVSPAPATARAVPSSPAVAQAVRTCTVDTLASDPALGTLQAQVRVAKTGQVLFDRSGSTPHAPASVTKIVTAAAVLSALGPDFHMTTTVVSGPTPGSVILVGGGDSTLTRLPDGVSSYYTGAAHIDDLAQKTVQAMDGTPITTVYVDTSLYGGPAWQPTWNAHTERIVDGSSAPVTALEVDGGRANPQAQSSTRTDDPVTEAANAFIAALDQQGEKVPSVKDAASIEKKAGTGSDVHTLASVQSQPASALLTQALTDSDNTIMETLARQVAIKEGTGNTFSAENAGILKALAKYGIPTTGISLADGSGLSADDAIPPDYLTRLLQQVQSDQNGLGVLSDALPVAGQTGTLGPGYDRFLGQSALAIGHVRAKTGSVDHDYTLAGIIDAQDGTTLTFAIYAYGPHVEAASAHTAIDALTTGFYTCGANLSDQ